eukprot:8526-Eustigmatos_ZCMA.PRE.1
MRLQKLRSVPDVAASWSSSGLSACALIRSRGSAQRSKHIDYHTCKCIAGCVWSVTCLRGTSSLLDGSLQNSAERTHMFTLLLSSSQQPRQQGSDS